MERINPEITKDDLTKENKLKWWGEGEWVDEEDEHSFQYKGCDCKILRVYTGEPFSIQPHVFGGHLCGYVKVPLEMKLSEKKSYDLDIDCHGGITFNEIEGEENWIGFDCAHSYDIIPSMEKMFKNNPIMIESRKSLEKLYEKIDITKAYSLIFNQTYKNMGFCIQECKSIVDQLILMIKK